MNASTAAADAEAYLRLELVRRRIPGLSVAVSRAGRVLFTNGYGHADVEWSVPATSDTVYEIASLTKPFTAIAILMLVEGGRMTLDDRLSQYLTASPPHWADITIRRLLTHTSGIPDYFAIPVLCAAPGDMWEREYAATDLSNILFDAPLEFDAGDRFAYSNSGYWLLGLVIEAITGDTWERFVSDRILVPLGMKATRRMDRKAIISNRASGYRWRDSVLLNAPCTSTTWAYSEGGLVSSVSDLVTWDAALWSGQLLRFDTLAQMTTPVRLNDGTSFHYGLGWILGTNPERRELYVTGHKPGFSAIVRRFPDEELSVFVLANMEGGIDLGGMASQLASFFAAPR